MFLDFIIFYLRELYTHTQPRRARERHLEPREREAGRQTETLGLNL